MTNKEFKCWIEGYLALTDETYLTTQQVNIIYHHAQLVKSVVQEVESSIQHFVAKLKNKTSDLSSIELNEVKLAAKEMFA